MNIPENLKYTRSHEWLQLLDDGAARMGITDFAQGEMGVLVFIDLPQEGEEAVKGEGLCEAESVKAVSEIYSPVNGSVRRVNRALEDAPESVNDALYDAWMVELENVTGAEDLMDAAAYREFLKSEGHE